jgi:hypothetical protein
VLQHLHREVVRGTLLLSRTTANGSLSAK